MITVFRLSDGKSIHSVSALLFQLVSSCCTTSGIVSASSSLPDGMEKVTESLVEEVKEPIKRVQLYFLGY